MKRMTGFEYLMATSMWIWVMYLVVFVGYVLLKTFGVIQ